MQTDLVDKTKELAKASKYTIAQICSEAGVKPRWYAKFKAGEFKDPGASKVERLHNALVTLEKKSA